MLDAAFLFVCFPLFQFEKKGVGRSRRMRNNSMCKIFFPSYSKWTIQNKFPCEILMGLFSVSVFLSFFRRKIRQSDKGCENQSTSFFFFFLFRCVIFTSAFLHGSTIALFRKMGSRKADRLLFAYWGMKRKNRPSFVELEEKLPKVFSVFFLYNDAIYFFVNF